jgi:hypothetical protein
VLVVQGSEDEAFRERRQDELIVAKLGDRARHLDVPGVGHSALLESPAAIAAVRAMIEANGLTTAFEPEGETRPPTTDAGKP